MHTVIPIIVGCVVCILRRLFCSDSTKLDNVFYSWLEKQHKSIIFVFRLSPAIGVILYAIIVCVFPIVSGAFFVKAIVFCGIVALVILIDTVGFAAREAASD